MRITRAESLKCLLLSVFEVAIVIVVICAVLTLFGAF